MVDRISTVVHDVPMSIELVLHQTEASGTLGPSRLTQAFASALLRGRVRGSELRIAAGLSIDDAACAGFTLEIIGQGRRVRGAAHGPSSVLLCWAFHMMAKVLGAALFDATANVHVEARPEAFEQAALGYAVMFEAEVTAMREGRVDMGGAALLAWLAREEHIALGHHADALAATLPLDDAVALYEKLLDDDAVDDVFVSERELALLLARFRARLRDAPPRSAKPIG